MVAALKFTVLLPKPTKVEEHDCEIFCLHVIENIVKIVATVALIIYKILL